MWIFQWVVTEVEADGYMLRPTTHWWAGSKDVVKCGVFASLDGRHGFGLRWSCVCLLLLLLLGSWTVTQGERGGCLGLLACVRHYASWLLEGLLKGLLHWMLHWMLHGCIS